MSNSITNFDDHVAILREKISKFKSELYETTTKESIAADDVVELWLETYVSLMKVFGKWGLVPPATRRFMLDIFGHNQDKFFS